SLDPRSGAAISIPTATLLFAAAAPFALDLSRFSATAALLFALVGLFFPAVVTLLNFRSNELLGPTVTSTVSGTTPLFALVGAAPLAQSVRGELDRLRRLVDHGRERGPAAALAKDAGHAAEFRLVRDHRGAQRRRGAAHVPGPDGCAGGAGRPDRGCVSGGDGTGQHDCVA